MISKRGIENAAFFILVALITVAFLWLIKDLLQPLFWATVLAIIFHPLQERFVRLFRGNRVLASLSNLAIIIFLVLAPLSWILFELTKEALDLYNRISAGEFGDLRPSTLVERHLPAINNFLAPFGLSIERLQRLLAGAVSTITRFLASQIVALSKNALQTLFLLIFVLYILYFFLHDARRIVAVLVKSLPIGIVRAERLLSRFAAVSRATVKGMIVISVLQGGIGGLFFWILGIDGPIFWGAVMTVMALLPVVGTPVVWVPAAIILFFTGHTAKAIILILAGAFIIGSIDNILRPLLVGRDVRLPDYIVAVSTLGGLIFFGLSGFVIGPVIAAFFLSIWSMFTNEYLQEPPGVSGIIEETRPPDSRPV